MTDAIDTGETRPTTESELWERVRAAEDVLNSDAIRLAGERVRNLDIAIQSHLSQAETLQTEKAELNETLCKAEQSLMDARAALRVFHIREAQSLTRPTDEDVHAAIKAMADALPATADRSNEPEEGEEVPAGFALPSGAVTIGDLPRVHASDCSTHDAPALDARDCAELPALADLSAEDQAEVEAVLDDDKPFPGLGGTTGLVIGRAGEVSDAAIAEAQALERREAEHANGAARFNPWA